MKHPGYGPGIYVYVYILYNILYIYDLFLVFGRLVGAAESRIEGVQHVFMTMDEIDALERE